ncbi:KR domain-containing protein [Streptomyces sp. NPDC052396]|uniref:KR domain-containing protein n=1 Tax=Streptomyces sp. NPDC052396 TaxID=3365689 RepID=UPI0037D096AE
MVTGVQAKLGATLPVVFLTVHYGLGHLAHLTRGETVLVHGATGGVGLAAIQYARLHGAQVIATAGNEVKRDLLRALGVEHVLDSRDLRFAEEIRRITEGRGVDVVLNSLAGEAVSRGLEALRPGGRFVELGKRDVHENKPLRLGPFGRNIAFFGQVTARAHTLDVCDTQAVRRIIMEAEASGHPLRGVIHSAMHLEDGFLGTLTDQQLRDALNPKMGGAAALDALTRHHPLDLFLTYSSGNALIGNPMQSSYAAGNLCLEALTRKRRAAGLPAIAIEWGAIGETGYVARNHSVQETLSRLGILPIAPGEAFRAAEDFLARSTCAWAWPARLAQPPALGRSTS